MRYLALLVLLFSGLTFASGKVSVQNSLYPQIGKMTPTFGLSVYERLFLGLNYNMYSGIGWQPRAFEPSVMWFTSRHDLETWYGDLGIAVGYTFRHAEQEGVFEEASQSDLHVKVIYKLW